MSDELWGLAHAERAALADDLAGLDAAPVGAALAVRPVDGGGGGRAPDRGGEPRPGPLAGERAGRPVRLRQARDFTVAGRVAYCDDLSGPGLPTLRERCVPA
ncbi:hypothetical protein [Micromonospora sp. WMMD975]|uniref:hypothetical protein n=1 Tax=Micromonospora sp. WMMD975 TaxID=3016087 RepID=UPI00249B3B5C|nr:hypothetical protein [Micromonospora sp. WMMD975]WFE35394.1 hypothetical protein O7613_08435 [Micromonospora sp. WMMD975]